LSMRFPKRVIPSRGDGEGPPSRSLHHPGNITAGPAEDALDIAKATEHLRGRRCSHGDRKNAYAIYEANTYDNAAFFWVIFERLRGPSPSARLGMTAIGRLIKMAITQ
jgi:hypothetical protein